MGLLNKIFNKNDNVYIIYDEKDSDIANEVCEVLEYNGFSCWIKHRDADNSRMVGEIMDAIKNSALCVVIYSENSKSSNFVVNEVDTAFSNKIPFIVFKIDDINLEGSLEFFLHNSPRVDAYPSYATEFHDLISKSLRMMGKSTKSIKLPRKFDNQRFHDVFISYSSKDREIANLLLKNLELNGFKCWIAPRNIESGVPFDNEIARGIRDAELFFSVFSENYQESEFTNKETELAFSIPKPIVAFKADSSFPKEKCEFYLKHADWIDGSADLESAVELAVRKVSIILHEREIFPKIDVSSKFQSSPKTENQAGHDIFISYSTKDHDVAEELCAKLEDGGFKCWIAPRDIKSGTSYSEEIDNAIKTAKLFIAVFSINFQESVFTNNELDLAFSNQIPLLAFRLNSYPEGSCEFFLRNSHWIDAEHNLNRGLESIVNDVGSLLGDSTIKETELILESDKDVYKVQGDSIKISGTLKDNDGNPLSGEAIKINAGGNNAVTLKTNGDGSYTDILYSTDAGNMKIDAMFEGNEQYLSSDASINVEVCKLDVDIQISAISDTVDVGNVIALSGSLKIENKAIARANVDIYNGDDLIDTVVTSNAGKFSMLLPTDVAKTFHFKAVYEGSDVYGHCETAPAVVNVVDEANHSQSSKQDETKLPLPAYMGDDSYIFISYSHNDSQLVFPEIERFHNKGYNIWYDEGIAPGNEWLDEIANALLNSSLLIAFITQNSVANRNVQKEINWALKNDIPVLKICLEEAELPLKLEFELSNVQSILKYNLSDECYMFKCISAFKDFGIESNMNDEIEAFLAGFDDDEIQFSNDEETIPHVDEAPFPAYDGGDPYAFISYSHKDYKFVFNEIERFHKQGLNIWYDEGIAPGNEWLKEISKYLAKASLFIVFISNNSVNSKFVKKEINFAMSRDIPFIAIHIEKTKLPDDLDLAISDLQAILQYGMNDNEYYRRYTKAFNIHLEDCGIKLKTVDKID